MMSAVVLLVVTYIGICTLLFSWFCIKQIIYIQVGVISGILTHNQPSDAPFYSLDSGPSIPTTRQHQFYPLLQHINAKKRYVRNSDQKYFVRISTGLTNEKCWVRTGRRRSPDTLQIWSSEPLLSLAELETSEGVELQIDKTPLRPFVLPPNSKWEIIIDPDESKMELFRLDPGATLNAVIAKSNEPVSPILNNSDSVDFVAVNFNASQSTSCGSIVSHVPIKKSLVIATGSCLQQRFKRLKAFGAMSYEKPDIIVLTGDNIYLDMIPYQYGCACCLS